MSSARTIRLPGGRGRNAGAGRLFTFHGSFTEKTAAQKKEAATPGSFIRTVWYRTGPRYAVLSKQNPRPVTAYGVVTGYSTRGRKWQQEHYESKSGDARIRAKQLRKLGFKVSVSSEGAQVTPVGTVRMTMITVDDVDPDRSIPAPDRVERMNPEYSGDPRWTVARFPSKCKKCGRDIAKGEQIFYYPRNKTVYCNREDCGKQAARDFGGEAADERFLRGNPGYATAQLAIAAARRSPKKHARYIARKDGQWKFVTLREVERSTHYVVRPDGSVSLEGGWRGTKTFPPMGGEPGLRAARVVNSRRRNVGPIEQIGPGKYRVDNERGTILTLIKKPWGWEVQGDNVRTRVAWRGAGVHTFKTLKEVEGRYKAFRGISEVIKENPRGGPPKKKYCEMCGRKSGLRQAPDPAGKEKTLCRECRQGSAGILAEGGLEAWKKKQGYNPKGSSRLTVPERHQLKIARDTLRMPGAMAGVMGGPSKAEAREIFRRLMAKARGVKNPPSTARARAKKNLEFSRWQRVKAEYPYPRTLKVGRLTVMQPRAGVYQVILPSGSHSPNLGSQRAVMSWIRQYGGGAEQNSRRPKRANSVIWGGKRRNVTWGKSGVDPARDTAAFKKAVQQLFPGKEIKDLSKQEFSAAAQLAWEMLHGKKKANPVQKVPGGWRAVVRGRMGPVLPSRRDAEIYADSFRNPPRKKVKPKAKLTLPKPTRREKAAAAREAKGIEQWMRRQGIINPRRRRNAFQEVIKEGSRQAVISANQADGPYWIRLYVNNGETATLLYKKAKTIAGARKIANKMLEPYRTGNPRRRRNYEDATDLYTKFHGKEPDKVTDTGMPIEDYANHPELGQLGKLVSITFGDEESEKPWKKKIEWQGKEAPDLAAEPGGAQLYIIGGNQDLGSQLESLPIETDKEMLDLGFAYQVEYFTRKAFDNHQPVTYYHDLGEETGDMPRLVYDRTKQRIHIVGGAYKVKPEGIVN